MFLSILYANITIYSQSEKKGIIIELTVPAE